jgi:hypothetical protein
MLEFTVVDLYPVELTKQGLKFSRLAKIPVMYVEQLSLCSQIFIH